MIDITKYIERIKHEEGFTPYSFWDDAPGGGEGQWTWGYGTCAPGPGCVISTEKAEAELHKKVEEHLNDLEEIFWTCNIPEEKRLALLDMLYNLGETRFRKFTKMIAAVKKQQWEKAAKEVRNSIYYKQVTNRAEENAQILEAKV